MALFLPTRGTLLTHSQRTFSAYAIRINRALLCDKIIRSVQFDRITQATKTKCRFLSDSRSLDEIHRRWYCNKHLHHGVVIQTTGRSLTHTEVRPQILSLNLSTSSGYVPSKLSGKGHLLGSDYADSYAQLEGKLDLRDKSMIDFLMEYKGRNGDCHVPTGNTKNAREEREQLGVSDEVADWVVNQRKLYRRFRNKKGKLSSSLAAKFKILESIGFMWSCREAKWQRSFNKLEEIYRSHNEWNLLKMKEQENPQLHAWIEQQRKTYRKGLMPMERGMLLREIAFVFDPNETRWWENYRNLCRYHKEHGSTMVPLVDNDETPNYLGQWVARQRRLYHMDSLSDDRISALNDIDFSWDPEAESWENYYNQLCDFHQKHNHTRVPKSMGSLWNWVDRQRRSYRKRLRLGNACDISDTIETETSRGTLITNENVQKLSTLGFEWEDTPPKGDAENRIKRLMNVTFELSIHDENWAKHYDKLCAFHKKFKHFSIPTGSDKYKELNTWVRHTRYLYNSNKLPKNRVELLDSIGFAWTAEDAKWDRLCEEFLSFHEENGHSNVPLKNTELYRWAEKQKENCEYFDQIQLVGTTANNERWKRLRTLKKILF